MKRIAISLATVVIMLASFTSAVYAQSSDDESLTGPELAQLLDGKSGFHMDPDYSGRLPTREEALEIIRLFENLSVTITAMEPTEAEVGPHVPSIPSSQAEAIRRVRKVCSARIWFQIRSGRIRVPLSYIGKVIHTARMEVQNRLFVDIVDTPQDVEFRFLVDLSVHGFDVYDFQGWSDDPYNRREWGDGWIFGSFVTVRAHILGIGFNVVNSRDLSCKVSARR